MTDDIGKEINYSLTLIKKLTPYLNDVSYTVNQAIKGDYEKKLNQKQRGYAWYYVYNGGNKTDAYRRSTCSKTDIKTRKLVVVKNIHHNTIISGGARYYKNLGVRHSIELIRKDIEEKIRVDVPQTLLEQLQIQATYDPSMFINTSGNPAFKEWEEIPREYRCCVEGIETKHYGKDGFYTETVIKLVNRKEARKELMVLAPDLLKPTAIEILHKTIDSTGKECGIDMSKYTDEQLTAFLKQSKV